MPSSQQGFGAASGRGPRWAQEPRGGSAGGRGGCSGHGIAQHRGQGAPPGRVMQTPELGCPREADGGWRDTMATNPPASSCWCLLSITGRASPLGGAGSRGAAFLLPPNKRNKSMASVSFHHRVSSWSCFRLSRSRTGRCSLGRGTRKPTAWHLWGKKRKVVGLQTWTPRLWMRLDAALGHVLRQTLCRTGLWGHSSPSRPLPPPPWALRAPFPQPLLNLWPVSLPFRGHSPLRCHLQSSTLSTRPSSTEALQASRLAPALGHPRQR